MSLTPIQELRYTLKPRLTQNSLIIPVYKYQGYIQNRMMPRGVDSRNVKLEERRVFSKDAENVRLIQDRPLQ